MILGKGRLRINKNEKGAGTIEFAIVAALLFTLLFGIVDFSLMAFANLTMQHAVREGTRYTVTGRDNLEYETYDEANSETRWLADDRFNAMVEKINRDSMGFFDHIIDPEQDIVVTDIGGGNIEREFEYDNGTPGDPNDDETWTAVVPGYHGDIIVVTLNCTWPLLTPLIRPFFANGEYNFTVASTMRNEQFDPVYEE